MNQSADNVPSPSAQAFQGQPDALPEKASVSGAGHQASHEQYPHESLDLSEEGGESNGSISAAGSTNKAEPDSEGEVESAVVTDSEESAPEVAEDDPKQQQPEDNAEEQIKGKQQAEGEEEMGEVRQPSDILQAALAAADAAAGAANVAAKAAPKASRASAATVAAAAAAVSAAVHTAAKQKHGSDPEDDAVSAVLAAADAAAAIAAKDAISSSARVHAAAAAAAVAMAARQGAEDDTRMAAAGAARAAAAVHKAAASSRAGCPRPVTGSHEAEGGPSRTMEQPLLCLPVYACSIKQTRYSRSSCGSSPAARRKGPSSKLVPGSNLGPDDLVYVTYTTLERHVLVTASRGWRRVSIC